MGEILAKLDALNAKLDRVEKRLAEIEASVQQIPDVPKALYPLIIPLEILGQFMRLISLSVRLYANMLAGHMLILTFIGLIFVLESLAVAVVAVPAAATSGQRS